MSAPGRIVPQARWALALCLLVLTCVVGTGWSPEHDGSAASMAGMTSMAMQHDSDDPPSQDAPGHCINSSQQCHQATVDSGAAFIPTVDLGTAAAASTFALPAGMVRTTGPSPRPPDLHALCVNRV